MHAAMEVAALVKRGVLSVIMPACANAMNYDMLLGVFGVFGVVMSYGVYLVLFCIAVWSTYQETSTISFRMRILAILMFFIVTLHATVEVVNFCVWRPPQDATAEELPMKFYIMPIIENLTPCLAGLLSDGFLAWRCYVIWGRRRWMHWLLPALVMSNSALGLLSNIMYGARFKLVHRNQYQAESSDPNSVHANHEADIGAYILLAWSWWFFAVNTAMTLSIIARITYVSRLQDMAGKTSKVNAYPTIIRAIIESSLISWIGLLGYNIPYIMPAQFNVTAMASVCSDTIYALLPLIFAISQSLIIARLGLTRFVATVLGQPFSAPSLAAAMAPSDLETGIIIERRGGKEKGHWTTMSMDMDDIHAQLRAL